jgi:NADP-dependent 3-hydroxy acid dehydrogenase YdfG
MHDVTGKVAFITGGASGMGLAMARSFSAAGMKVAIADIQQDALDRAGAEFKGANANVITLKVDAMDYKDWDWVMGVNLAGVINGIQTFLTRIEAHGEGGHIVNTASMAGHLAIPGLGVYNTTKYAVVGLSETLRADLAAKNIGVSVLCPGVVSTNIFDSGRNRPAALKGDVDTSALAMMTDVPEAERAARLAELVGNALDPAVVGDMVLAAIQANDPYIFTHPDLKAMVDARSAAIGASFERWAQYRKEHGV